MKEFYIENFKEGLEFIDFFMVKAIDIKVGSNKKEYLDIQLGDKTGEVSAKKWDLLPEDKLNLTNLKTGDLVKVKAQVITWQGNHQLKIHKIRPAIKEDELILSEYIKAAPEDPIKMYEYILDVASKMEDDDFRRVSMRILERNREKLMYYPAASKNHHALYAGLLYHMKRMIMSAIMQCSVYQNLNQDLVVTGVIIHDMEKINEIDANEYGVSTGYSFEGQLLGHIASGIRELDYLCNDLEIPREKAILLEHMILSHHYEPEFGSPKKPMFPEAELLHYLDIVDARMFDMQEALKRVPKGEFSERVWVLDNRKLYKPSF